MVYLTPVADRKTLLHLMYHTQQTNTGFVQSTCKCLLRHCPIAGSMKRKRKLESDEGKHETPQRHHKQVHVPSHHLSTAGASSGAHAHASCLQSTAAPLNQAGGSHGRESDDIRGLLESALLQLLSARAPGATC